MTIFFDTNQNKMEKPEGEKTSWRISVYSFVQSKDGKVLMVIPKQSTLLGLPGGSIELEESILEGMVRECYEETGYKIEPTLQPPFYLGESNFYCHSTKKFFHSVILVFPAHLISEQQDTHIINKLGGDETNKVVWVPLNELNEKNCHPMSWSAIKVVQQSNGRYII